MQKMIFVEHKETSRYIKLSSLDMLIQDIKCGIRVLLLYQSEFTMRRSWSLQIFLIAKQGYPKSLI